MARTITSRMVMIAAACSAAPCAFVFVFVSGSATAQSAAVSAGSPRKTIGARAWPRSYRVDGVEFQIYRPQLDSWDGDTLKGRAVVAVSSGGTKTRSGQPVSEPTYGVVWFTAQGETDKEAREVVLDDLTIERASFPAATAKEATWLAAVRKAMPTTALVESLDVIESSLAINDALAQAPQVQVNNQPPEILVSLEPATLVLVDGDPAWRPTGVAGVDHILNSRAAILRYQDRLYLGHAGKWATSISLTSEWSSVPSVPQPVSAALKQLASSHAGAPHQPNAAEPASVQFPHVYVRTKPAELIVIDGEPQFDDIGGTKLSYVVNTPADVFLDAGNSWYVLVSGRWFTAASTMGPWRYVEPDRLPADFAKIPSDGPKGAVLASITGTPEAKEALIANSIPQTATVDRKTAAFTALYDGAPQFDAVSGTAIAAARNSPTPIFRVSADSYVALDKGVWFAAGAATGPWTVAAQIPTVIYTIPSSSPLHYVTYVRIYSATATEVHVGYTPGYYGAVATKGVVVYGTGYVCDAWVGTVYYGCPATYGYGAAMAFTAAAGWAMAFGFGWYDPWYYPYWGPYWGGAAYAYGNVYGHWGSSVVAGTGAAWANAWTGNYGRGYRGGYYNTATGGRGYGYAGRNTNVYTGNSVAAAGGIRYNPRTGRVVAGQGGTAGNIYTGNGIVGGTRTAVNTDTGRVTRSGGAVTRSGSGATAAGGFDSRGRGGNVAGAGYVHYDRATGDISKGGVVDAGGQIYAGKDGHVYRYNGNGDWQSMVGGDGSTRKTAGTGDLDRDRAGRDRGLERDSLSGRGFDHPAAQRQSFDRSSFGGGFSGRMGGFRGRRGPR